MTWTPVYPHAWNAYLHEHGHAWSSLAHTGDMKTIDMPHTATPEFKRLLALGVLALGAWLVSAAHAGNASAATSTEPNSQSDAAVPAESLQVDAALYTTQSFDWQDASRKRAVPAKIYLPAGSLKPGGVPLVVFSHGIGGSKDGYSYLGRYFAAHGYASMHVQHVGSDRQVWSGNPLRIVARLTDAAQESEALNRVQDVKFALDRLLGEPVGTAIDASRLVAAGHSYGANTTLLLAGAKLDLNGQTVVHRDPRFSAAILISAPPFYGLGDPQKILGSIEVPTLHITATADDIQIPGYQSGLADRLAVYKATGTTGTTGVMGPTHQPAKVLAVFKDGSHSIFTDRMGTGGMALNPKVKLATRQLALAFLNWLQVKDDAVLAQWPRQHADILASFERSVR